MSLEHFNPLGLTQGLSGNLASEARRSLIEMEARGILGPGLSNTKVFKIERPTQTASFLILHPQPITMYVHTYFHMIWRVQISRVPLL